jgi:uncharacterized protein (TIGR00369 family)
MTVDELQEFVNVRPFLSWLGIKVLAIGDDTVEARATWRPEWVTSPTLMQTHGGILAALIDFAADFSLVRQMGGPVPTVDMRVDYHRLAKSGDLIVKGRIIKLGKQFATCEAHIYDLAGALIASGRGTYITAVTGGSGTEKPA